MEALLSELVFLEAQANRDVRVLAGAPAGAKPPGIELPPPPEKEGPLRDQIRAALQTIDDRLEELEVIGLESATCGQGSRLVEID